MSILIKNMEMPVTCCNCPLMGYDSDIEWVDGDRETKGAYICVMTGELIDNTKREDHCPLVPVPPHGRLIDADRVSLEGGPYEYDEWCKWALDQYQDAPTIIPAEPCKEKGE